MRLLPVFIFAILFAACGNRSGQKDNNDFLEGQNGAMVLPVLPDAPRWMNDSENLFNETETDTLNKLCNSIFELTGHMPMIHTVAEIEPYSSLNEYTSAIDALWSDKGQKYFIIIISDALEEVRIIHGEITESKLPGDFTDRIMQMDMFPEFKQNNYFQGIHNALNRYLSFLK